MSMLEITLSNEYYNCTISISKLVNVDNINYVVNMSLNEKICCLIHKLVTPIQ